MSGIQLSSNWAKLLWPGINSIYGQAYDEFDTFHDMIYERSTSRKQFEEDLGTVFYGLASVKPEGAAVTYDTARQGFVTRYTHVEYALGFIISKIIMEDDQYDIVGPDRAMGLAFSMRETKEIVAHNVLNRAFNSSYTGGDGKEMLADDHPNVSGGTWANELATPADLSEAALEQACIDLKKFTNDRGLRINVRPMKLIIPVDLGFEAIRILRGTERPATADRDINALNYLGKFKDIVETPYLTDTDAWFITTSARKGLRWFERRADEFTQDNDFDTDNAKFKATARYSFGWTDPRGIFGSPGA